MGADCGIAARVDAAPESGRLHISAQGVTTPLTRLRPPRSQWAVALKRRLVTALVFIPAVFALTWLGR